MYSITTCKPARRTGAITANITRANHLTQGGLPHVRSDHLPPWIPDSRTKRKGTLLGIAQKLNSRDQDQVESRRIRLLESLDMAIAPGRVIKSLANVGLTASDLAIATGANKRTTAAWLDADCPLIKKKRHQQRLRELKEVTRFIVGNGTIAYQEADWLRDPNRAVDFATPLELIGEGRWKEAACIYCDDVVAEVPSIFRTDDEPQPVETTHT